MMALLHDFGVAVSVTVHTDASAAIGLGEVAGDGMRADWGHRGQARRKATGKTCDTRFPYYKLQ